MAAAYFRDLGLVFRALRPICRSGSLLCFVIGDSAPYGVYLDVDTWLGELAVNAGFKSYSFEKIRDRNVKWKNRKHRVPLKEGRLWIEGRCMAKSPSHKFGQLIGNLLEELIEPFLTDFAKRSVLYLDYQKNSRKARKGKKGT